MLAERQTPPELLDAMEQSLKIAWQDLLQIFQHRREVLDLNANFHEKIGECLGKMSALEVACRDTMLPMEIDAIQEFLTKFKQLRIDVLASVMVSLKEGNELLAKLRETAVCGQLDSRPDSVKVEVKKSLTQVEMWLEELHDRRNSLEQSWQSRKLQLEQCLALAILSRDLTELEKNFRASKTTFESISIRLESEKEVAEALNDYVNFKQDVTAARDRALKITRSTEKLTSLGSFSGDDACAKAYEFLNECTEYLEYIDSREHLFSQMVEFFGKAEKALDTLRKLEEEASRTPREQLSQKKWVSRILNEISNLTAEPLRLGYALLDQIGRSNPDAFGVEKMIAELDNRKVILEEICEENNKYLRVTESLTEFHGSYEEISAWLVSVNKAFLRTNNVLGPSTPESKTFLRLHHQLLSDLQNKGTEINDLLNYTKNILTEVEEKDRQDVDQKVQTLHDTWTELRFVVENRVDLASNYLKFLHLAEQLAQMFASLETSLRSTPDELKLQHLGSSWSELKSAYSQLKAEGNSFIESISKVSELITSHSRLFVGENSSVPPILDRARYFGPARTRGR